MAKCRARPTHANAALDADDTWERNILRVKTLYPDLSLNAQLEQRAVISFVPGADQD
jgi:hypothetical protein